MSLSGKIKKSKISVQEHDYAPQRKEFWTYYLLSKFRCHSLNILGVKEEGGSRPPPASVPGD